MDSQNQSFYSSFCCRFLLKAPRYHMGVGHFKKWCSTVGLFLVQTKWTWAWNGKYGSNIPNQMKGLFWYRCGAFRYVYFGYGSVLFFLGWRTALLWFSCGTELCNRSGLPKCRHSTQHVGWMTEPKVLGVGWIWATAILLSGLNTLYEVLLCAFALFSSFVCKVFLFNLSTLKLFNAEKYTVKIRYYNHFPL